MPSSTLPARVARDVRAACLVCASPATRILRAVFGFGAAAAVATATLATATAAPPAPIAPPASAAQAVAATIAQSAPLAPAADRGRALYETRCIACHDRSVHQRETRKARDFESLRAEVARWNATAGGEWRTEEIDLVAAYLNERWYRFPCPPAICRAPGRAALARPGA